MPRNPSLIASAGGLRGPAIWVAGGVWLLISLGACTGAHRTRSLDALDARAIVSRRSRPGPLVAATRVYRGMLSRSLYSRCRMFPSDSELFDARARACGATDAAVLGVARLLLEVEASPEILPITVADRRLRWLDAPSPRDICAP